eukprot:13609332-Alexandrium_andersonii.AAC.1
MCIRDRDCVERQRGNTTNATWPPTTASRAAYQKIEADQQPPRQRKASPQPSRQWSPEQPRGQRPPGRESSPGEPALQS